ncbi:hypothetical protein So717_22750 [Roseobacter cerasinus]|uniref:Uncharacterized protein n=1 Tax=Roseobacter cerasinus TaxID=2602289 RepID=A0A640VS66_9RHOB|nr:hypothetical protein [Roseobacter cerasinus]GFE50522.1 hypothetical protein So717_22750 [Roseobacter cerasinus]
MEEILETVLSEDVVSTVALADGGHLTVWASPNGTGTGIWGQRYDAAGVEVGAIYPIYTSAAPLGTSVSTEMARLDNGDIALVFAANDADASGIYHVTLDQFGQLDGMVPEVANTFETGTQFWHSVSALSGGGYVVTWESSGQDGSGLGVFGQVFSAAGVPVGSEFQANSYTTSNQHIQNVTGLADGGFLVTWYSAAGQWGSDASGGIFAQRFDATGTATGVEFHVNTSTDGTQYDPYVVDLQDGGFAVLWTSHETDNTGLFFQRYDADGATVGEETQAAGLTGFNRFDKVTSVIKLQDGGFAVLWNDVSETALKVQSFDIQGNAITDIHSIATNAERVTTNNPPDLDQLADGRLVVTWVTQGDAYREILQAPPATAESSIGQGPEEILETVLSEDVVSTVALADGGHLTVWASPNGTGTGIWGQRYDAAGVEVGAIYPIYTSAAPLGTSVSTEMARLDNGDIALVFAANDADASGIYHVTLDQFGQLDGMVPEVANTFETGTQFWHSVSALSGGGYVVTWESSGQDGSGLGVFGQVFSAAGVPVGSEFQANSYTTSNQHIQNVTGLADGGFLVTWYSAAGQWGSDASGGIFAQRFDATGTATGVEFHVNTSTDGTQYDPYVVDLQDGGFAVLWTSHETDNTGLFFQRYDADGATVGEETQAAGLTGFNRFDKVTSVIKLQDGGFAVLWNDVSETALKVQSFDIQGNAITDIHSIATNAERVTTNNPPDLDQLADGRLVVTWVTQGDAYREILQARPVAGFGSQGVISGTSSNDVIDGTYQDAEGDGVSVADDFILAVAGDDIINSADGDDVIYGGSGNDLIDGGAGNDTLTGDAGTDTLTGGSGADVFVLKPNSGSDTITDFDVSEGDLFQIHGLSGQSEINLLQIGGDTEIRTTSGDVLAVVEGVHLTDFSNFLFG